MPFVGKRSDFKHAPCDCCANGIITDSALAGSFLGKLWIVERGFHSDGGSVPRLLWPVAGHPLKNSCVRAYVTHDRYYKQPDGRTKALIDRMMYEALRDDGVGIIEAQYKWTAVRWWPFAWRAHRRRDRS